MVHSIWDTAGMLWEFLRRGGGVCAAGVCGHFWALCIEWLAVVGCRGVPVDAFGSLLGLGRLAGLCLASRARRVRASSSEIYRTGKLQ